MKSSHYINRDRRERDFRSNYRGRAGRSHQHDDLNRTLVNAFVEPATYPNPGCSFPNQRMHKMNVKAPSFVPSPEVMANCVKTRDAEKQTQPPFDPLSRWSIKTKQELINEQVNSGGERISKLAINEIRQPRQHCRIAPKLRTDVQPGNIIWCGSKDRKSDSTYSCKKQDWSGSCSSLENVCSTASLEQERDMCASVSFENEIQKGPPAFFEASSSNSCQIFSDSIKNKHCNIEKEKILHKNKSPDASTNSLIEKSKHKSFRHKNPCRRMQSNASQCGKVTRSVNHCTNSPVKLKEHILPRKDANHTVQDRISDEVLNDVRDDKLIENGLFLGNDAQQDELVALRSIYEEDVLVIEEGAVSGKLYAQPTISKPFYLIYPSQGSDTMEEASIDYLPPMELDFRLPPEYPKIAPPIFKLSCKWLTLFQLKKLCTKLETMWSESQDVVLFQWMDFLVSDSLSFLGVNNHLDISRLLGSKFRGKKQNVSTKESCNGSATTGQADLLSYLKSFDRQKKCEYFYSEWFTCNICFMKKQGRDCMSFHVCSHIFCCECLKQYFSVQISDGNVHSLTCPEEGCSTQALPSEVHKLVGEELFARYDKLLLVASLNSMSDVIYCPRLKCQCPVVMESGSTMACCPACTFAFCIFCKMAYHGIAPCRFKEEEKRRIAGEYMNGNSEVKAALEKRYGRLTIRMLVDEIMSESWMKKNSKKCPHCQSSIEKIEGCNKMVCWRCNTSFCWLCLMQLKDANPYAHFNNPASPCFNQLFHGALPEEVGEEVGLNFDADGIVEELDDDAEIDDII